MNILNIIRNKQLKTIRRYSALRTQYILATEIIA